MSDHNRNDGSLVTAQRRDMAPIVSTNPLVSRGLADLADARSDLPEHSKQRALSLRARLTKHADTLQKLISQLRGRHPFDVAFDPKGNLGLHKACLGCGQGQGLGRTERGCGLLQSL